MTTDDLKKNLAILAEQVGTHEPSMKAVAAIGSDAIDQQALAKFGAWVIEQMQDEYHSLNPWGSEDGNEAAEKAVALHCPGIERVKYDPELHGECEAEPGQDIFWFGGK
jgi:hypothetical protein